MINPPKVILSNLQEYREFFKHNYCRFPLKTPDGIDVFFRERSFEHCMFESTKRDGRKDLFSNQRAKRIGWIGSTLINKKADLYQGWNSKTKSCDPDIRVAVAYEEFVVVIRTSLSKNLVVKAEFVTAYLADNSISKIRSMPRWDQKKCRWFAMLAQRQKPR